MRAEICETLTNPRRAEDRAELERDLGIDKMDYDLRTAILELNFLSVLKNKVLIVDLELINGFRFKGNFARAEDGELALSYGLGHLKVIKCENVKKIYGYEITDGEYFLESRITSKKDCFGMDLKVSSYAALSSIVGKLENGISPQAQIITMGGVSKKVKIIHLLKTALIATESDLDVDFFYFSELIEVKEESLILVK